jgi:RecA/RadA recombinase
MKFPLDELNQYFKTYEKLDGLISVWGDYGVGKTTLVLQILKQMLLEDKNGIFIYTKNCFPRSFLSENIQQIKPLSSKLRNYLTLIRILNFPTLFKTIFNLELIIKEFSKKNKKISYIVIDSLTNLYNIELTKKSKKNYILNYQLNMILSHLTYLIKTYELPIIIVNELTHKKIKENLQEMQSGGNVMEFWTPYRIKIKRTQKIGIRDLILENRIKKERKKIKIELSQSEVNKI